MAKQDIRVEVLSDPRLLKSIRGLVREYLASFGVSAERIGEVVLAVDEACTNAIRHAYGLRKDRRIELILTSSGDGIEIVLRDEGVPAPADRVQRREFATPDLESLTPGGLGVQLIYEVFDEVEFTPGETVGNCVVMRLKTPA